MFLECRDIRLCITRLRDAFAHHVTDRHFVVDIETLRDDVLAIKFVADDAGANGVAVEADKQIEKRGAVADLDVSRAVKIDSGERFFGKVERVEIALFVSEVREGFKVFEGDFFFFGKWILGRHEHVKRRCEKRFKYKVVLLDELGDDFFVFVAEVEYAHFAFHFGDIVNNFIGLRFAEGEVVARTAELANNIDECVDGKRVVLTAHRENGVAAFAAFVAVFQKRGLFQDLPCVREEFVAFVCNGHAFVGAVENGDAHFFFELVDGGGETRLRDENALGCFGDVSRVCNGDGVFQLL